VVNIDYLKEYENYKFKVPVILINEKEFSVMKVSENDLNTEI